MGERTFWAVVGGISLFSSAAPAILVVGGAAWGISSYMKHKKEAPTVNAENCIVRDNKPSATFSSITYDFNSNTVTYARNDLKTEPVQNLQQLSPLEKARAAELALKLPKTCTVSL